VLFAAGDKRLLGCRVRDSENPTRVAPEHATQPRGATTDGGDEGPKIALGRWPGIVTRRHCELSEGPPHGLRPVHFLGMGGPEDVTDKRPIVHHHGRPQRGAPRSDSGRRRSRWEDGVCPPQQRRPIRRRGRRNPALRWGGARALGGGRGRRGPIVCNGRFGGLCMHEGNNLHWLVTARVKSLSGNWARATVSALSGRMATTVGGTVVAGK